MSQQVIKEHEGLQEGLSAAATLEGLLYSMDPLLLVTGAGLGGFPVPRAPAWLPLTVGGLEEIVAVHDVLTTFPACDGFLPTVLLVLARVCTE